MDKHQKAIYQFVQDVAVIDPICSIYAKGSIGNNSNTSASDVDIDIVTWRFADLMEFANWELKKTFDTGTLDVRFQQGFYCGIQFDVLCLSPRNFHNLVMKNPLYLWPPRRIFYDPSGLAAWGFESVNAFFEENPELAIRCRIFKEEHSRWKADMAFQRQYETFQDFVQSVDISNAVIIYTEFSEGQITKL